MLWHFQATGRNPLAALAYRYCRVRSSIGPLSSHLPDPLDGRLLEQPEVRHVATIGNRQISREPSLPRPVAGVLRIGGGNVQKQEGQPAAGLVAALNY